MALPNGNLTATDPFADMNYRDIINKAYSTQGMQPYFADTTSPIGHFDQSGAWVGGGTQAGMTNPMYQQSPQPGALPFGGGSASQFGSNFADMAQPTSAQGANTPMSAAGGTPWFDSLNAQYQSVLGRNMDPTGMDYWKNLDANTGASDADLQKGFMDAAQRELGMRSQAPGVAAATYQQSSQNAPDFASGGYGSYTQSPYLTAQADDIQRRTGDALGQAFNGIRGDAVGVGGLGGSRQGVAEAGATGKAMDSLQGNLANLYGQDYQQSMNRGLQRYQADQGFNLGQGQLGLGYMNGMNNFNLGQQGLDLQGRGQDQSFYSTQRGQDLAQTQLGANILSQGMGAGWIPLDKASGIYNTVAGNNLSQTDNSQKGGGLPGIIGGLGAGWQWWQGLNK